MPARKTSDIAIEIITALVECEDFPYSSNEEVFEVLKKHSDTKLISSFIPKKTSSKPRASHAWAQFLKENKAQPGDETKRLGKQWDIIKNAEDKTEFNKYQAMADAYNKEHNVEASSSTSGNTQKEVEAWLQANIKRVQVEGTYKELWDRPVFTGKKPSTQLNNYKAYLTNELGLKLSKAVLDERKKTDEYSESETYGDKPWYNYIEDHMVSYIQFPAE